MILAAFPSFFLMFFHALTLFKDFKHRRLGIKKLEKLEHVVPLEHELAVATYKVASPPRWLF